MRWSPSSKRSIPSIVNPSQPNWRPLLDNPIPYLRASAPRRHGALPRHYRNAQAQARHLHPGACPRAAHRLASLLQANAAGSHRKGEGRCAPRAGAPLQRRHPSAFSRLPQGRRRRTARGQGSIPSSQRGPVGISATAGERTVHRCSRPKRALRPGVGAAPDRPGARTPAGANTEERHIA